MLNPIGKYVAKKQTNIVAPTIKSGNRYECPIQLLKGMCIGFINDVKRSINRFIGLVKANPNRKDIVTLMRPKIRLSAT